MTACHHSRGELGSCGACNVRHERWRDARVCKWERDAGPTLMHAVAGRLPAFASCTLPCPRGSGLPIASWHWLACGCWAIGRA